MASSAAIRPAMGALGRISSTTTTAATAAVTPRQTLSALLPHQQIASISTTAVLLKRHKYPGARDNRDYSKKRGESAIRRTGTRWRLSMSDEPLPRPVSKEALPPIETDPNHGLWEFFYDRKKIVQTPEQDAAHGRAWTVEELRHKSWEDLHKLWWVCVKERNRIATANWERRKQKLGFGEAEAEARDRTVRSTMRAIKHVLTERFYLWEDARKLAENDPEVDLSGNGPAFTPRQYLESEEPAEGEPQAAEGQAEKAAVEAAVDPAMITTSASQSQQAETRL